MKHSAQTRTVRIISRAVVHDAITDRVLLVRNTGETFWYPPGGGWNPEAEDIRACAKREAEEETGQIITIVRLIYTQEFHAASDMILLEWFWLAEPNGNTELQREHQDLHGVVVESRWFSHAELQGIKVFPERLKTSFWENLNLWRSQEDPFIGVS